MKYSKKHIGIALGGGAVLGAFHIGVLKRIEELKIDVKFISGTSIGALIGAIYASGVSIQRIEKELMHISWADLTSLNIGTMGLLSNSKVKKLLMKFIPHDSFEELQKPFIAVATDISTGEEVRLNTGSLSDAVMASMSIPGMFHPVEIDGRLLVDGGVVDNIPVEALKDLGANYIVGVDLFTGQKSERPKNTAEVLQNTFRFLLAEISKHRHHGADILIQPDLHEYSSVSTKQLKELIDLGYKEALVALDNNK